MLVTGLALIFIEWAEAAMVVSLVALSIGFIFGILQVGWGTFSKIAGLMIIVLIVGRYTKKRQEE